MLTHYNKTWVYWQA